MKFKIKEVRLSGSNDPQYVITARTPFWYFNIKRVGGKLKFSYDGLHKVYGFRDDELTNTFIGYGYTTSKTYYDNIVVAKDVCDNLNYIYGVYL